MNVSATFVDSILTPKQVLPIAYHFMATKELPFIIVFEKKKKNGRKAKFLSTLLAGAQYSHLVDLTIYLFIDFNILPFPAQHQGGEENCHICSKKKTLNIFRMISMKYIPRNEANTVTTSSLCVQELPLLWFCPQLCKQRASFTWKFQRLIMIMFFFYCLIKTYLFTIYKRLTGLQL